MSQDAIATQLNNEGVLAPMEYKQSTGSGYQTGFLQNDKSVWSSVTVRRILENEIYIGNLVQGKRTTPSHLDVKRKNGEYIGAFVPYGYEKSDDDKHKLVIDIYAAGIVKEIFRLKLHGMS